MGAPTVVSVETPAPRAVWRTLLAADAEALLEQGPRWVDALRRAGGWHDASRLYRLSDGRSFVLPLVRKLARDAAPLSGFGPSWGIGGLVGADLDSAAIELIHADLRSLPAVSIHLRPNPTQGPLWSGVAGRGTTAIARRAHVIDVTGSSDDVFARLKPDGRRRVRNAERGGVSIATYTGGDGIDGYYHSLYLPSLARWADKSGEPERLALLRGKRRDPIRKLQQLGESLGDGFRLTLASKDGSLCAGNIVLSGPNGHYTRGAMNDVGARSNASYLAMWHAIRHEVEAGSTRFHLGESGTNPGLSQYKERFGAVAIDYCEYRYERVPLLKIDQKTRAVAKRILNFQD